MPNLYDGFWFPSSLRNQIITPNTPYEYLHFSGGAAVPAAGPGTVTVRWPRLDLADWKQAIARLRDNQRHAYTREWQQRLPGAVRHMRNTWLASSNPLRQQVLEAITTCTGHSVGMLDLALRFLDLISVDDLQRSAACQFTQAVKGEFVSAAGLPGRIRFFGQGAWRRLASRGLLRFGTYRQQPWHLPRRSSDLIVGYAAGNVLGTGLLLVLLGLAAAARKGSGPPIIIVKNSSREPLFTPLVLSVLEMIDAALLETTLVTLWDYDDRDLQDYVVGQADLVVAAASDETIAAIGQAVKRVSRPSHPIRFHRHGHKVSFSLLGRECLARDGQAPVPGTSLVDVVALLASLDSAFWNQQGCLSSRVHFVEQGTGPGYDGPEVYARAVAASLRALNDLIPKGIAKRRQIHNLFDKYQAIAATAATAATAAGGDRLQVLSTYDDDFMVVLDRRPLTGDQFREVINDCQGRTVVVIPVDDVMDVPRRYLRHLRPEHLQSISLAVGDPQVPGIDARLLRCAEALGAAGVTAIRTVGRGAFPQLALSWDGLLPLDLMAERPRGHFTALEFDEPWAQIRETYALTQGALEARGIDFVKSGKDD